MVSFSAGGCRVVEEIKEVTWAKGLFCGTDQRREMGFCAYGVVAIKSGIAERRKWHASDSLLCLHGGPR